MSGNELPSGSSSEIVPASREEKHRRLELHIMTARRLFGEAWKKPSVMEGFGDWEIDAADTFREIHFLAEDLGYGIAPVLRLLAGTSGLHISSQGDEFIVPDPDDIK